MSKDDQAKAMLPSN